MTCNHQGAGLHLPSFGGPGVPPEGCAPGRKGSQGPWPSPEPGVPTSLSLQWSRPGLPLSVKPSEGWDFASFLQMEGKKVSGASWGQPRAPHRIVPRDLQKWKTNELQFQSWRVWNRSKPRGRNRPGPHAPHLPPGVGWSISWQKGTGTGSW